jgi:hypothetical protein
VRFKVERDAAGHIIAKQRVSPAGTVLSEVTRRKPRPATEGSG